MPDFLFPVLPSSPQNILFVCTGNSCRSVFAEGVLKKMLANEELKIHVHSAGTAALTGKKAAELTLRLLQRESIDLNTHLTQKITLEKLENSDIVFVMENAHREKLLAIAPHAKDKIFLLSQFYTKPEILPQGTEIPDPMGMYDFFHENVNDIIKQCCERIVEQLKQQTKLPNAILIGEKH